jgi:hypothetical protein
MERPWRSGRVYDWLWFLAWCLASSLWCWTAARDLGATFDEPVYIQRGLQAWRTGSHEGLLRLGTMPLPVDVDTLPLYLWERWHGVHLDPANDLERLLPWARTGTLVFWWLLLIYARLAGRQLAGAWGGRLAVALIASEPAFLAHASLATTDLAVTACLLAFVYHYRTGRDRGWVPRVALPAFWFGATVLAKASGLVFGPICILAVELSLFRRGTWGMAGVRRDFTQILAGGLLVTFLYCGTDWKANPAFVEWTHRLPDNTASRVLAWSAEHLRIFSNAGEGLVRQVKHNVRGHGTYLLGKVADRYIWYYFPLALTIKLSLPLLILPLLLALARPRTLLSWACLAALALLAVSATYRVQIGIRFVLPLVALATVGAAAAAVLTCRELAAQVADWQNRSTTDRAWPRASLVILSLSFPLLVAAGVIWTGTSAVSVWPNGLCYTNELWGGTRQGYLYLSDSNYDWGQGLKELAHWQEQHRDVPLDVWYFGSDPALRSLPMRQVQFESLAIQRPDDVRTLLRGHDLAVSTSLLYGSIGCILRSHPVAYDAYQQVCAFLTKQTPVDRTTTFLIYDFREAARGETGNGPTHGTETEPALTAASASHLR